MRGEGVFFRSRHRFRVPPKEQSKPLHPGHLHSWGEHCPNQPPPFIVFSLLNGVFVSCLGQKPRRASSAKREPAVAEHELTMRIVKSSTFETWAFDATSRVDAHNHAIPG